MGTNGGIDDIALVSAGFGFEIEPLPDRNGIAVSSLTSGNRHRFNPAATGSGSATGIAGLVVEVSQDLRRVLFDSDGDVVPENSLPIAVMPDGRLPAGQYGMGKRDDFLGVQVDDRDLALMETSGTVRLEFVVWVDGDVDLDGRLNLSDLVAILAS